MEDVRSLVEAGEKAPRLPGGDEERFAGYGVMAAPFRSGHLLALRRFPASSIGGPYTSVWHRSPSGEWTFWSDQPAALACPRYFGRALATAMQTEIALDWHGPVDLTVSVPAVGLRWSLHLAATLATRFLNRTAALMPARWWRRETVLRLMAALAGRFLRAGRLGLYGEAPNGHRFVANPTRIWVVDRTQATLGQDGFGEPGPLVAQVRLGDFWIPQRGLFAIGQAFFTAPAGASPPPQPR